MGWRGGDQWGSDLGSNQSLELRRRGMVVMELFLGGGMVVNSGFHRRWIFRWGGGRKNEKRKKDGCLAEREKQERQF